MHSDGAVREIADPLGRVSRAIDAEFTSLFGAAGPNARAALKQGVGYQRYDVQPAWRMLHNIAATRG